MINREAMRLTPDRIVCGEFRDRAAYYCADSGLPATTAVPRRCTRDRRGSARADGQLMLDGRKGSYGRLIARAVGLVVVLEKGKVGDRWPIWPWWTASTHVAGSGPTPPRGGEAGARVPEPQVRSRRGERRDESRIGPIRAESPRERSLARPRSPHESGRGWGRAPCKHIRIPQRKETADAHQSWCRAPRAPFDSARRGRARPRGVPAPWRERARSLFMLAGLARPESPSRAAWGRRRRGSISAGSSNSRSSRTGWCRSSRCWRSWAD